MKKKTEEQYDRESETKQLNSELSHSTEDSPTTETVYPEITDTMWLLD